MSLKDGSQPDVPRFDRNFFSSGEPFSRIGKGEFGGKARGLISIRDVLEARFASNRPDSTVHVRVPTTVVITTDVFEIFMERNRLEEIAFSEAPDDRIANAFQKADLPTEIVGDLRALADQVRSPLAIRSSSLLEDAIYEPFAGVYATKMIPNNQPDPTARFRAFVQAIKYVYASTFFRSAKAYAKAVRGDEFSGELLPQFGTAILVEPINAAGAFPTRNARDGQFEHAEKISGETMAKVIKERGGKTTHKGCAQCIIDCSNEYVDADGKYITSSLEYETIWSMGGMIGNGDLDAVARLDFLCDDIGLDTISTGVAIAVAMDAGYREFGDGQAAIAMVEEVAAGTEMGKLIGNGPTAVGKHFNHDRVPVIKGQSMAAYDPRAIQGMAVTYATSPMGGDHTAGWVVDQNLEEFGGTLDRFSAEGQVEASRDTQIHMAAVDSVGICDFAQSGLAGPGGMEAVYKMVAAKSGKPFGEEDWTALGTRVLKTELEFNRKAGFTSKDDRLPKMFYEEPLPPTNKVVVITDEQMDSTFDF